MNHHYCKQKGEMISLHIPLDQVNQDISLARIL